MNKGRFLTRREFLGAGGALAAASVLAACAAPATPVPATPTPAVKATPVPATPTPVPAAKEAPAMVEQVKAGKLPPLANRLPLKPFVVAGAGRTIGVYGGEVRQIHHDVVWSVSTYDWYSDRLLQYADADLSTLTPCMLDSWEASPDGTSYTLFLRKGMKWSDGVAVTTADVDFWWNDWATVEGLGWVGAAFGGIAGPGRRAGAQFEGAERRWCEIEIIDEFSFRVKYGYPFGLFPHVLTRHPGGYPAEGPLMPKHFLKDYHIKYAGEAALKKLMGELQLERWEQVLNRYAAWGMNIWQFPTWAKGFPTLAPWIPVEYPAEGLILFDRNPFYWKVDQAGNQLPYIDKIRLDFVASVEAMDLKAIGGELDWLGMHDVTIARYPLYKENQERGRFVVGDYLSCMTDRYILFPRHTLPGDAVLEKLVNHPNWVKALSLAIDREEINESLFFGLARMGAHAPMPMSKYYKKEYGEAWTKYDVAQANKLLDEMGLQRRDAGGYRLRPDGKRLGYHIEHAGIRVGAAVHEFTEMVCTYWREIGIEATTKEIADALYGERMNAGEIHCGIWHADRVTDMLMPIEMHWFLPTGSPGQGGPSHAWVAWYNALDREAEGLVEPPPRIRQLLEWNDQVREVVDEKARVAWGQRIFDDLAQHPLAIGSVLESPCPLIANKNLRNLPRAKVPVGWDTYGVNTYHPAAFFFEGGKRA